MLHWGFKYFEQIQILNNLSEVEGVKLYMKSLGASIWKKKLEDFK